MLNIKNERGSITLFVLVSCMFFIASVVCVQMYMQSKQVAVDREYRQIKSNYETNINDSSIDELYTQLSQVKNLNLTIENITQVNNQLVVELSLNPTTSLAIKTIKYGWGTSESIDTVSKWSYIEVGSINDKMIAIKDNTNTSGDNHLFVVLDKEEYYLKVTV